MATRTKTTTTKSRGATASKRSTEVATAKAGDRTCAPGRTVGEAKHEKESPQRTPRATSVANPTAGQTLSEPKRAQPPAKPSSNPSKPAPSAPTVAKAPSPAVSSASPLVVDKSKDADATGRYKQEKCLDRHISSKYPSSEAAKQVSPSVNAGHTDPPLSHATSSSKPSKLNLPNHARNKEKGRRSKPTCWAFTRGQCHNENCPKRHPRKWDPQLAKEPCRDDSDDDSDAEEEEPAASVKEVPKVSHSSQSKVATLAAASHVPGAVEKPSAMPTQPATASVPSEATAPSAAKPIGTSDASRPAEIIKMTTTSQADNQVDRRPICRNYSKGYCRNRRCPRRHIDTSETREAAAQSEQHRHQSPAVDTVDSVAIRPPPSEHSSNSKSTAESSKADIAALRSPAVPSPPSSHILPKSAATPMSEANVAPNVVQEPTGIGDPSIRGGAVCQFFKEGQCIAANCKLLHELPKSTAVKPSSNEETLLPAKSNRTTTAPPTQVKADSSKPRETVEPSPLYHLPFSSVADLGAEEATSPAQGANSPPPRPSGLPPKPEPPQHNQPVRGWNPDPRPARRYYYTCRQYRRGECSRGDNCHFFHTLAIDNRRASRDSKVCQLYLIGACDYGNGCFRMHILPDSPTLTFPARRPDSAPQTSLVSEVHAGAADTKTIPSEKLEEANTDQVENCVVGALVVEAEQVVQDTNIPTVGRPADDTSPIDNMAQPEATVRDRSSTRVGPAYGRPIVVDDTPARRSSIPCRSHLQGQCRFGDACYKTHSAPNSEPPRASFPKEVDVPLSRQFPPAPIDVSVPQAPTPTCGPKQICLNWLVRHECLNGTSCAYEHSTRGALALAQHAAESSGSITPMPTGGTNYSGYPQKRQQEPRDHTGELHTYRTQGPPHPPPAAIHSGPVPAQGATVDCFLNLINGPAYMSQVLSPNRQGDRTATISPSTWREPVIRNAQRAANARIDESARYSAPGDSAYTGFSNVGPRLWQSHRENQEVQPRIEQSQAIRNAVAIDPGENSSDSSFHSAEDFSDTSIDTSPSTASSVDSLPASTRPQRPVCQDFFFGGRCDRPVCFYRHELPPEEQSMSTAPQRELQADIRPTVRPLPRGADTSRRHAREDNQPGNMCQPMDVRQSASTQAPTVPLVPPGLGLEAKRPGLAPPPAIPRREPLANLTLNVLDSTKVTYGAGFDVQSIVTAFETRQVILKDLPRGIHTAEVSSALKPYGEVTSIFFPDPGRKGIAGAKVTFATPEQAASAACALDGLELFGTPISARLWSGQTSLVGKARLADGDVLFEFPCAHKTAYVGYSTRAQADKAISLANESEVKGNWVVAELHEGLPSAGAVTVRFRGLPASTQMKDLMRYGKAEGFMVERPNYESTKAAIHRLRVILEKFGHEFLFNLLPPPYKRGNVRAYAHFETAEAAEAVCAALNNRRQPFCGYGKLTATHISTLVYQLPRTVFNALAYDIRLLNAFVWRTLEPGSSISIIDNRTRGPHSPVCIKLAAQRYQALTKMKTLFDRLLHGERIEQGGEIVWDTFFARRAGIFYLEDLQRRHAGVLINRDPRKGILALFGPEPLRRAVRAAILAKVGDLRSRKWYSIDLPGRLIGLFWGSDLATLQQRFGEENVTLDTAARTLRVRGDDAAHEAALLAVKQARERHADEKSQPQVECPVCFTEVTNPVKLDCGHTWCKSCLQNYLRASIDNASFPLVCLGDEARCPSRIPIHVAQEVLSTNEFNDILEAAFRAHVHSHPKEYHYCPTPDCKQVYHRNTQNHALQCPSCLLRICPKCNAEYHEHSPCQGDEESDRALFEEWKRSHDVKDCPGCKAPIEREAGCNHMTCVRCKTHICWVCLATFEESGEVYAHMHSIHGGIGLEEV